MAGSQGRLTLIRSRRHRTAKPTRAQRALQAWLERQMADPVAARLAFRVVGLHAGLVAWMAEAERARVLPGGALDGGSGYVTETRDPDDAMLRLVTERLDGRGLDPEHLDPTRHYLTNRLGELAGWYAQQTGGVLLARWEPLAVRLGDLTGDQVAANALATCLLGHHHLAVTALTPSRGVCQAGRERWRRLAERYVRTLDEQPSKGRLTLGGRVQIQTVEGEGERRFG